MPKTKISEFSATPANNTDIDSINIAEGCAPSGINDAIRELMAQLKDFQTGAVGDSFNGPVGTTTAAAGAFTTLSASSTVTLSGGTANGVAYLNGSKVVTSGSALTFDGTNFGTTGNANLGSGSKSTDTQLNFLADTGTQRIYIERGSRSLVFYDVGAAIENYRIAGITGIQSWGVGGSEQMRLTSTGLGIGTSSPAQTLHVKTSTAATPITLGVLSNSTTLPALSFNGAYASTTMAGTYSLSGSLYTTVPSGAAQYFSIADSIKATLDSSGNLGLGVTPSAWGRGKAFEQGSIGSAIWADTSSNDIHDFLTNAYLATSDLNSGWRYAYNGYAVRYEQISGTHRWFTAASGTAGNAITFTQAMTLDASGNLLVGTTTSAYKTTAYVSGQDGFCVQNSATGTGTGNGTLFGLDSSSNGVMWSFDAVNLVFGNTNTERARIDSSGNFAVGQTPTTSINSTAGTTIASSGYVQIQRSAANPFTLARFGSSAGTISEFYYNTTSVGSISITASATAYNTSSDYRLKDNPQTLTGSGEFIDALKPKTWNWKVDGSKGVGFLAHEAQAVSPSSVSGQKDATDEEGKPIMQAMEYGSAEFIANIIAELQSLRQRVAQLEAQ